MMLATVEQVGQVVDRGPRRQPQRVRRPEAVVRRALDRQLAAAEVEQVVGLVRQCARSRVDVEDVADHRREDAEQDQDHDDRGTDDGQLVLTKPLECDLGRRPAGELLALGCLGGTYGCFGKFSRTDAHARPLTP
jgi:hypothetical protein